MASDINQLARKNKVKTGLRGDPTGAVPSAMSGAPTVPQSNVGAGLTIPRTPTGYQKNPIAGGKPIPIYQQPTQPSAPAPVAPAAPAPIRPAPISVSLKEKPQPKVLAPAIGNTKPLVVPPVTPSTIAEGLETTIASSNESAKAMAEKEAETKLKNRELQLKEDRTDIGITMDALGEGGEVREESFEKEGGYTAQKEVDRLTSEIEAEQLSSRRRIEELENKNAQGLFQGGLEQEVSRIRRESAAYQADLAIQKSAALRQYDTATEIADRKKELYLEPLKTRLDTLKFFYQENKEDFNKADDRLFDQKIKDEERAYDTEKERMDSVTDMLKSALIAGASSSIIKKATKLINEGASEIEVAEALGVYADYKSALDIQKTRLDMQKLRADISGGGGVGIDENSPLYNGLKSATATAVRAQVGAYKTEPTIQNFAVIQDGYNFASSISTSTQNPADDQALIYSLAKALDPGSVVREGEYATAQKYAQSWVQAYGKGVTQAIAGTGFLSETARKNIKNTIKTKYESSQRSYSNLRKEYIEGINNLTGRQDGAKFIKSYQIQDEEDSANPFKDSLLNTGAVVNPSGEWLVPVE